MSTVVGLRRQEIGIRLALGARSGAVTRMIVAAALRVAVAGAVVGVVAAWPLSRVLRSVVTGVGAASPWLVAGCAGMLVAACAAAAYLPARRAARIDPMAVLRA
jgi:ABC-type antimicrobial peptide transport system permease subunit